MTKNLGTKVAVKIEPSPDDWTRAMVMCRITGEKPSDIVDDMMNIRLMGEQEITDSLGRLL